MTQPEMHTYFKINYDKLDSSNLPNLNPTEIDSLLNQGQDRIIKQRYGINNNKRQSFEETQKRAEDLKEVVRNSTIAPSAYTTTNIDTNAQFVTLPTDHWFTIQERVEVMYPDCKNNTVKDTVAVTPIQHNEFNKAILNPFKKPSEKKILRLMYENQVELIHATNHVLGNYFIRYIKKPVAISSVTATTSELSDHLHSEICDEAIRIALENIEAKRTETYAPITQTTNE